MPRSDRPAPPTVLIVDDDVQVLDVLCDLVSNIGYATVAARTGVAGIAVVRADPPPDAVLLDIAMPGSLDGVETLRGSNTSGRICRWLWSRPTSTRPSSWARSEMEPLTT